MTVASQRKENLFDLYFEFVEDTESPIIFHRWSIISAVGALLGRQFWLPFGSLGRVFPNCYIMLIGNPGARKSAAIKTAKKQLAKSGFSSFSADKTTKEKFLLDLEGKQTDEDGEYHGSDYSRAKRRIGRSGAGAESITPEDVLRVLELSDNKGGHDGTPREVYICADEFNEFAGSGNIDFLSLLGNLWDWDDESATYQYRLKNSRSVSIYQPTVSLLGGNTHTGLQNALPVESLGQGFMSRMLLVYSEPSGRKIAFPAEPSAELQQRIADHLGQVKETVKGAAILEPAARRALETIYVTWKELEDYRFKHYSTRRFSHLLKLVLICAAMRCSVHIDMQDVLLANTMLSHIESQMPKALGEFGKSKNSDAAQAVMAKLYETNKPLNINELWTVVSRDLDKRAQLVDILSGLREAKKIQYVESAGGFLPVQKPVNTAAVYVDYKLLREMKGKIG